MSRPLALIGAPIVLAVAACTPAGPGSGTAAGVLDAPTPSVSALATPDDSVVNLTVYLRSGTGADAVLRPVHRQVPVTTELPRRALELLLSGPDPEEDATLDPPLPTTTQVLGFHRDASTAVVNLSREVLDDADTVGADPYEEALALAAVANTLTEFPAIDRVEVTVDGRRPDVETAPDVLTFWGGWGLPEVLIRDDTVVESSASGELLPDLARFGTELQSAGEPGAEPVHVTDARVRDRITYLRIAVQLSDAADPDTTATAVPRTWARGTGEGVLLELENVAAVATEPASGRLQRVDGPSFDSLDIEPGPRADTARITLASTGREIQPFYLHIETSPTRIVLDVKK